ncbi:cytochrome b562 [Paludibacterium yongneupense]|uniref:cytochrome b562 n=1 Tax=Paludibacterium yongneupense TaxID=400061 RepID=UPI0004083E64|nr:cytochrome b562 [Paludibacterium yongneupense]
MSTGAVVLKRRFIIASCVFGLGMAALSPTVLGNEVKQVMKDMRREYNAAMASTTIAEFGKNMASLHASVGSASHINFSSDPATYQQGMQELEQGLARVDLALKANDLAAAKNALRQMNSTKKHYHDLLN